MLPLPLLTTLIFNQFIYFSSRYTVILFMTVISILLTLIHIMELLKNLSPKIFMIIMKYHELGDLTHYVTNNFFKMSWSDKLQILDYIITGLKNIHHANIIHKDYHSGNIFVSPVKFLQKVEQ